MLASACFIGLSYEALVEDAGLARQLGLPIHESPRMQRTLLHDEAALGAHALHFHLL